MPEGTEWVRIEPQLPALPSGCARSAWRDLTRVQMRAEPMLRVHVSWEVFRVAE